MTIPSKIANRIRRLVPSLASSFDGEAIAARNAINRELEASGSDWHALAACIVGLDPPPAAARDDRKIPFAFGDLARAARDLDRGRLSDHERRFVTDMCRRGFGFSPSPRQSTWMADLYRRLSAERAAA